MEIKAGDKVRVSKDAPKMYYPKEEDGIVMEIDGEDALIKSEGTGMPHCSPFWILTIPTKYLVKVDAEAEKKPNVGSIKIPVEVDITDSYWDAYTADLAREIAVKSMEKSYGCDPERIADYAVSVAKAVVEELKRK